MNTSARKVYRIVEGEIIDEAAYAAFVPLNDAAEKAAGARMISRGKPVAVNRGQGPAIVSIVEFESMEKWQAYRNSDAFKNQAELRDKAMKFSRVYAVEGAD